MLLAVPTTLEGMASPTFSLVVPAADFTRGPMSSATFPTAPANSPGVKTQHTSKAQTEQLSGWSHSSTPQSDPQSMRR